MHPRICNTECTPQELASVHASQCNANEHVQSMQRSVHHQQIHVLKIFMHMCTSTCARNVNCNTAQGIHTAVDGRRAGRRVARARCLMHLTMSTLRRLVAPTDVEACADVDMTRARHATTSHLAVNTTSTLARTIFLLQPIH